MDAQLCLPWGSNTAPAPEVMLTHAPLTAAPVHFLALADACASKSVL